MSRAARRVGYLSVYSARGGSGRGRFWAGVVLGADFLLAGGMESTSLTSLVSEQMDLARDHHSGRSAKTIHGGHEHLMRQTLIALASGHGLGEHDSPPEATLQVLTGRVRLRAQTDEWEGRAGDFVVIPSERHSLDALEDSAVLLTVRAD